MAIYVYGTGGMGREAAQLIRDLAVLAPRDYVLAGFIDDERTGPIHGLPVLRLADVHDSEVVVATGVAQWRESMHDRAIEQGLRPITLVHPRSEIGANVTMGLGTYIAPGCLLTCDITLGVQVQVNAGTLIHHDCVIGDFATISPRVTLCGNVTVGRSARLGAGCVVREGITIGEASLVGMGAVVIRDVPARATHLGNPARAYA